MKNARKTEVPVGFFTDWRHRSVHFALSPLQARFFSSILGAGDIVPNLIF
jgi:hypothetical protein